MKVIGVVGAGVMGTGVAHGMSLVGHQVRLVDVDAAALERARAGIERDCRASRLFGGPRVDAGEVLGRIHTGTRLEDLAEAEFVVENITENWERKRELYRELDSVCSPECVFVVNTSTFPITKVAALVSRPERVIGVHFMNPVPLKRAVEVVNGHHTSDRTGELVRDLLDGLGKKAIDVRDSCGFVSNRVLMLTVNEAAFLVHDGVASAATVDEVFRECFGHPMGPLETADLIGVDTILDSVENLHRHFGDDKFRPCPLLRHMVDAGLHGRKSGTGFYDYTQPRAGRQSHVR